MMTSLQIQYGGLPPYWKSYFGIQRISYCMINGKFGVQQQNYAECDARPCRQETIMKRIDIRLLINFQKQQTQRI